MRAFRRDLARRLARHRPALAVFLTLFLAYGYFHQGGGWNQNSRFAQVRSVVEEGSFAINRFCAYGVEATDKRRRLGRRPLPERIPAESELTGLNGLDVAVYGGRIYPNKPPGVTLLARPAYTVIWHVERALGAEADSWSTLTVNAYLTTVFSIGLVGALCGVGFLAISRRLAPEIEDRWHVAATLAFGLGTLFFPFATMLFDHVAAAAASLGGFGLALVACEKAALQPRPIALYLFAAGLTLGLGVLVNYTVVLIIGLLTIYIAHRLRRLGPIAFYIAGGTVPAIFLCWYHWDAFGSPFAIANTYEYQFFLEPEGHFLGVFAAPDWKVAGQLLFGLKRGLFSSSPIMLAALYGLVPMWRRRQRAEGIMIISVFVTFLFMNASFNAWHGGNSFGPRYLIPALPFLALPLVRGFARWPRLCSALAVVSVALAVAVTATDPQIPAEAENPLADFVLPALRGESLPALGALSRDPVSRNATGVYEAFPYRVFAPGSREARWNSFNLGELVFPASLWSLVPLLLLLAAGSALALKKTDKSG